MTNPIRILIADDHGIVRQALRQLLEEEPGMEVMKECANGAEAMGWLSRHDCDIALIDIAMPGMNGIELVSRIHREKRGLPMLVLSTYAENQYALRLIKAGISGYLTKECVPAEIVNAVRTVASGGKYFSQTVLDLLAKEVSATREKFPHESLSDREHQIFVLLASGKTVTEISCELALSVKTVSTYRTRVLEKMSLRNNQELIRYAVENNFTQ